MACEFKSVDLIALFFSTDISAAAILASLFMLTLTSDPDLLHTLGNHIIFLFDFFIFILTLFDHFDIIIIPLFVFALYSSLTYVHANFPSPLFICSLSLI